VASIVVEATNNFKKEKKHLNTLTTRIANNPKEPLSLNFNTFT
jgi:hypothetical protein